MKRIGYLHGRTELTLRRDDGFFTEHLSLKVHRAATAHPGPMVDLAPISTDGSTTLSYLLSGFSFR